MREIAQKLRRRVCRMLRQAPGSAPPPMPLYTLAERQLTVHTPEPPHPARNILFNDVYYTILDQCARGQGRHMTSTGFKNNVIDHERLVYVRDDASGEYFAINWAPVHRDAQHFECIQDLQFQRFVNVTDQLESQWTITVPPGNDPVEIWDVTVKNIGSRSRRLSLFSYVSMKCDGEDLYCGDLFRIAQYDPDLQAIFVCMDSEKHTMIDFPWHNGFCTADCMPEGWDASPGPFIGLRRSLSDPLAVAQGASGNSRQAMWPPIASLHFKSNVAPGETARLRLLVGACDGPAMIKSLKEKYLAGARHIGAVAGVETVPTEAPGPSPHQGPRHSPPPIFEVPEPSIPAMLNAWVPRQIQYGAYWGRWGWRGYRDTLQQSIGCLYWDASLARGNILEACAHQYRDGFALRGWRPVDTMRFADSAQWLVPAVTEYLKETADFAFLSDHAPYFDGGEGSVLSHVQAAMRRLAEDRGPHGLCLAWGGDWNDSLTGVCRRGQGESVWLSMAYCRDAIILHELYQQLGLVPEAGAMMAAHAEMAAALNQYAWDGEWYRCALDDDGCPIGSKQNEEGKIFLNMQSWAQLGRVCDDDRWNSAWQNVEKHLNTGWGLMLNWPCYTRPQANVGRMSYVRPGAAENGSVYTHGNAFMFLALLERGMADRALQLWREILPNYEKRPGHCQPNVFFNGFYGPDSEIMPGLADHAWMTGSCAWMYYGVIEQMLGLRRGYDGLRIQPCFPSGWKTARVIRSYRGTTYDVTFENSNEQEAAAVHTILVDGQEHDPQAPLPMGGDRHQVVVRLMNQ